MLDRTQCRIPRQPTSANFSVNHPPPNPLPSPTLPYPPPPRQRLTLTFTNTQPSDTRFFGFLRCGQNEKKNIFFLPMRFQQADIPPVALRMALKKVSFFRLSRSLSLSLAPAHSVISARLFWLLKIFPKGWRAAFIYLSCCLKRAIQGLESKNQSVLDQEETVLFWDRKGGGSATSVHRGKMFLHCPLT